jgi:electron transfer flavoprotein alpha subunit
MKNIGIIIELDEGKIKEINFGMITLARATDSDLFAFVLGADVTAVKEDLESYGITKIVDVALAPDLRNNPAVLAKAIANGIKEYGISAVFGLSTATGKDLLPRIAAQFEAPLVMDCFTVDLENNLACTSRHSGKTIASIKLTGDIVVFGVRPNAIEPVKGQVSSRILKFDGSRIISRGFRFIKRVAGDTSAKISLAEADVIISGGRGMKNGDNFSILSKCAEKLNGAVGASRAAVDSGWVPYSMQVGLTGEKVSPRVYIGCGISGSIQHFAGMKTSGLIIAINTDKNASLMADCDYSVQADVLELIPEITRHLENG